MNINRFVLASVILFLFFSCKDKLDEEKEITVLDVKETVDPVLNDKINTKLFNVINLDYPGLENAKAFYEEKEYYLAAKSILEYYRMRTDIVNPNVSLLNVKMKTNDLKFADYALQHRYYVKNYYEDEASKKPYLYWDEANNNINWKYWPTKANEHQFQLHRHQWFSMLARTYRVTKDEKYAKAWVKDYSNWIKKNPLPADGVNLNKDPSSQGEPLQWSVFAWRPLEAAERVSNQTEIINYFLYSSAVTPEFFSKFLISFYDHVQLIIKNYSKTGNHRIIQARSVTYAGVLFPEFKQADEWLRNGTTVLSEEMKKQLLDDGISWELDLGYHMTVLNAFYSAMLITQLNNRTDLLPANFAEGMKDGVKAVMNLMYPNYILPAFNDTRPHSKRVMLRFFNKYSKLFPDDMELKWIATDGKEGTKPTNNFAKYTSAGYYALRNGWDKSSTMMIYSDGPPAEYHSQPDNGTFGVYVNGRNFFTDSGCYAYSGPSTNSDREKFRRTRMHNTLTLNHKNLSPSGTFVKSEIIDDETELLITKNNSYPNLVHRRSVFFVKRKFFVLVDEAIGSASGQVNLNYHLCRGSDAEVVLKLNENSAYTNFDDKNNIIIRCFGSDINSEEFAGKESPNIGIAYDRKAFSVNHNKTADENPRFITVIYPVEDDANSHNIEANFTDSGYNANSASIEVTIDGTKYPLSFNIE